MHAFKQTTCEIHQRASPKGIAKQEATCPENLQWQSIGRKLSQRS